MASTSVPLGSVLPPSSFPFSYTVVWGYRCCLISLNTNFLLLLLIFLYFGGDFREKERGDHAFTIVKTNI